MRSKIYPRLIAICSILLLNPFSVLGNVLDSSGDYLTYEGMVQLQGDSRKLSLMFNINDSLDIRWTIENSGRYRIPLVRPTYTGATKDFSGSLSFFGDGAFGEISGHKTDYGIEGMLNWHGQEIPFVLSPTQNLMPFIEESINIDSYGVQIKGTLVLPQVGNKAPLVIFAHGSGYAWRWWGMYWAKEFAKMGIASFIHDKRGCGESGGDWTRSSLDDLSKDIETSITYLSKHARIDSTRIGIYGVSQGGWIAGKVGAKLAGISFLIANSGGGISPRDTEMFSYETKLRHTGIDEEGVKKGMELVWDYMKYLQTGKGRSKLEKRMNALKGEKWYNVLNLKSILVSKKNVPNWQWVATYTPSRDISKLKMPILLLFGKHDNITDVETSIEHWKRGLAVAENADVQVEIFENAGHGLVIGGHHASGFPKYPKDHIEVMKQWFVKNGIIGN